MAGLNSSFLKKPLFGFLIFLCYPCTLFAQDTVQVNQRKPNMFLDCSHCFRFHGYKTYLKNNINVVNFVRNKDVAQIHLLITRERTGHGTEWTLKFIGSAQFADITKTIDFYSPEIDTDQIERTELTRKVKSGLLPFILQTQLKQSIVVDYTNIDNELNTQAVEDPWNHWVFEISVNPSISGEEQQNSKELEGDINISRVTHDWKINISGDFDYERHQFELDSSNTITAIQKRKRANVLIVKSLTPHWSIGGEASISTSTFDNTTLQAGISPAIEFNIFPYREYSYHTFNLLFEISPKYVQYNDTTIYNKTEQFLIEPNLSVNYELTEVWGSVEATLHGSTYLYDLSKNEFGIRTRINFNIYKGFSFFLHGSYSLVNNQISLPKGGATTRQALLQLRNLATGYRYELGFGINFTFGSIYTNIVNTRFESMQYN